MKQKLGDLLVANGVLTHAQLDRALEIQEHEGGLLGMILVSQHYITEKQLSEFLHMQQQQQK